MAGGRQQEFQEALAAGHALAWDGHWGEAAEAYRRATTLEPQDPAARAFLAMAVAHVTGPAVALEDLRQIDTQGPAGFLLLRKTADLAVASGLSDEASSLLLQVGESLWQRGRQQDAIECWQQAVAQAPSFAEGRQRLAHAFNDLGEFAAAGEQLSILESRDKTATVEPAESATDTTPEAPEPEGEDTASTEQQRAVWTWGIRGTAEQSSAPPAPWSTSEDLAAAIEPDEPPPAEPAGLGGADTLGEEGLSSSEDLFARTDGPDEASTGETAQADDAGSRWESRPASWSFGKRSWSTPEPEATPAADEPPAVAVPAPEMDPAPPPPPPVDVPTEPPSWLGRIWGRPSRLEPTTEPPTEALEGEPPIQADTTREEPQRAYDMEPPAEPAGEEVDDASLATSEPEPAEPAESGWPVGEASDPERLGDLPSEPFQAPDLDSIAGLRVEEEASLVGEPAEQALTSYPGATRASPVADEPAYAALEASTTERPGELESTVESAPPGADDGAPEAEADAVIAEENEEWPVEAGSPSPSPEAAANAQDDTAAAADAVGRDQPGQPKRTWWQGLFGAREVEPADERAAPELPQESGVDEQTVAEPQDAVAEVDAQVVESASEPEPENPPAIEESYEEATSAELPHGEDVFEAPAEVESSGLDEQAVVAPAEAIAPVQPPEPPWQAEWERAAAALEAGDVVAALRLQEEVLAQALLSGDGGRLLDTAGAVPGLCQHAYRELSELQGRDRAEALLALARGAVFLEIGRLNAAMQIYEDLISAVPDFLPVQIELARALALSGRDNEAREKLEAVATVYELRGQGEIAGLLRLPTAT